MLRTCQSATVSVAFFCLAGCLSPASDEEVIESLAQCFRPGGFATPAALDDAEAFDGFEKLVTGTDGTVIYRREGLTLHFIVVYQYDDRGAFPVSRCQLLAYRADGAKGESIEPTAQSIEQLLTRLYQREPDARKRPLSGAPSWVRWTKSARATGSSWVYWNDARHEDNRQEIINRIGFRNYKSIPEPIEALLQPSYLSPFVAIQTYHAPRPHQTEAAEPRQEVAVNWIFPVALGSSSSDAAQVIKGCDRGRTMSQSGPNRAGPGDKIMYECGAPRMEYQVDLDTNQVERFHFVLDPEDRAPSRLSDLWSAGFPVPPFIYAEPVAFGISPARLAELDGFRDLVNALGPPCTTYAVGGGRNSVWRRDGIEILYRSKQRPVLWAFSNTDKPDC